MDGQRRFAVIGTDPRLAAAGRALARAGFVVGGPEQTALADYILLPLPLDESRTPLAELLRGLTDSQQEKLRRAMLALADQVRKVGA